MATYYWVGGDGTWDNASTANWSTSSGGSAGAGPPTNADTVNFDANSGTAATVTVAATAVSLSTIVNKSDINLSLSGSPTLCTAAGTLTFTTGTITLNNNALTCGFFASSNSNVRSVAFGTGSINLSGNAGGVINMNAATNFTYTGTPTVNLTYSGGTGTRSLFFGSSGGTSTNSLHINVTAGTDIVTTTAAFFVNNFIFTGFNGTYNPANNVTVYGDLTFSSGMTIGSSGSGWNLSKPSGTQLITTNGKTLNFPLTVNGTNGIAQLQDNLTLGATRTFALTIGTLDLSVGNRTLTCGLFQSSSSNIRSIRFGTGNLTVIGSGTVWNTGTVTNFSYTGTPTVNISNNSATSATVTTGARSEAQALNFNYTVGTYALTDTNAVYKNLDFTGFTGTVGNAVRTVYGNMTIDAGSTLTAGANATTFAATSGTQQITTNGKTLDFPLTFNGVGGTFAFQDALTQGSTRAFTLTNGTVQLKNGVTSTVGVFATSGANQKFLQSTSAGSQATISQASGTVNASYLTIQDSNATGGATWLAYVDQQNVDNGNNDGWDFGISPVVGGAEYTYRLRSFTEMRQF
jgi:hypothetical protein